jgi:hypothetical protein
VFGAHGTASRIFANDSLTKCNGDRRARMLCKDEARRRAANFARLPELLRKPKDAQNRVRNLFVLSQCCYKLLQIVSEKPPIPICNFCAIPAETSKHFGAAKLTLATIWHALTVEAPMSNLIRY